MVTPEKIEEWLKEVEARPESAGPIVKYLAHRLRDLSSRNEELLAENISLQRGEKTEEYKERITHLEHQLALLTRRFGAVPSDEEDGTTEVSTPENISLLAYTGKGRIIRLEIDQAPDASGEWPGRLGGDFISPDQPARLACVPSVDELLCLFTSGRVTTVHVADIPVSGLAQKWDAREGMNIGEAHPGERLVSLVPISDLPLKSYFLQASRRGCVKKTLTTISQEILANHFLGKGAIQKADQPFELLLCSKGDALALLTQEGILLGLEVEELSYSVEEKIKLSATDHLVAAFALHPDEAILALVQSGKIIHRAFDFLELAHSPTAKGQSLIPPARRAQGARLIGAVPFRSSDRIAVLDAGGGLSIAGAEHLTGKGEISGGSEPLALTTIMTR